MLWRRYSCSLSACRLEHTDPYMLYINLWALLSTHQHKSYTFVVLQCHNYCICLAHYHIIYDAGLYFPAFLMYYSAPLSLTTSALSPSCLCCWKSIHSCHYLPLCYLFQTWHTMFEASSVINACVSINLFLLPCASSAIRDWSIII